MTVLNEYQLHFIITLLLLLLLLRTSCFPGDGEGVLFFFPPCFTYIASLILRHSIWKKPREQIHCLHGSLHYDGFNDSINQVCTSIRLPRVAKETKH